MGYICESTRIFNSEYLLWTLILNTSEQCPTCEKIYLHDFNPGLWDSFWSMYLGAAVETGVMRTV